MSNAQKVWAYLAEHGDKSELQIMRACNLSGKQWRFARRELLDAWRIAIVGKGENKVYTVLNIARTK